MQGVLIVLAGMIALTMAGGCGDLQALKVKQQWASAYGTAEDRVDFGLAVFKGLVVFINFIKISFINF